jgi:sulfate transport system substrate-binding protein
MRTGLALGAGYLALLLGLAAARGRSPDPSALLVVSYDPTRELFRTSSDRLGFELRTSHGGSAAQARAVLDGLKADVVNLALGYDIDALADQGLLERNWEARFPNRSCPYTSTIVFLVRRGNPKAVRGWDDLIRPDVAVVTASPKTSGGARWGFLAAWGHVTLRGGSPEEAFNFVRALYRNAPALQPSSRAAASAFIQQGIGDALIVWESDARSALREAGALVEIVYPPDSILAEPPIAIVDLHVEDRGTRARAESLVRFLYSEEGQRLIAAAGFRRPSDRFAEIRRLFTIREIASSWTEAHRRFFAEGALFDRIFERN